MSRKAILSGVDIVEVKINFKCTSDNLEEIPQDVINHTRLKFPETHTNMNDMVSLSKALRKYQEDTICKLPFCVTVEAEAMGADINLGDEKMGPRVSDYVFNSIDELVNIEEINLSRGRIKQVLGAVENLSNQNEIVSLNVAGPFTIISSLIEPRTFYSGIRKSREIVDQFMQVIEDNIVKYALEGVKRGARIISYGDPVGALDIVGPRVYKEISGRITYNILKRVGDNLENSIIHLCGKTSTAFEQLGFSKSEPIEYDEKLTYGEVIGDLLEKNEDVKIIGHSCIKRTPLKIKDSVIWRIELENGFEG